jgi:hypothetical protein
MIGKWRGFRPIVVINLTRKQVQSHSVKFMPAPMFCDTYDDGIGIRCPPRPAAPAPAAPARLPRRRRAPAPAQMLEAMPEPAVTGVTYPAAIIHKQLLEELMRKAGQSLKAGQPVDDSHTMFTVLRYSPSFCGTGITVLNPTMSHKVMLLPQNASNCISGDIVALAINLKAGPKHRYRLWDKRVLKQNNEVSLLGVTVLELTKKGTRWQVISHLQHGKRLHYSMDGCECAAFEKTIKSVGCACKHDRSAHAFRGVARPSA